MNVQHLHLHVRDRRLAEGFYQEWLGLKVTRRGAALTFMSDAAGFDLALMDDSAPAPMPAWFHFGCRLASADDVAALHDTMAERGLTIAKGLYRDDTLASFRVRDPDGYAIEIYWEAPPPQGASD